MIKTFCSDGPSHGRECVTACLGKATTNSGEDGVIVEVPLVCDWSPEWLHCASRFCVPE